MKTNKVFISILSGILLLFFLVVLICFAYKYYHPQNYLIFLNNIIIAQQIVLALAACSVFIYAVKPLLHKARAATPAISQIIVLSEANTPMDEFSLINRTSALIVKEDFIYITVENDLSSTEYAVINRVESYWYIERVSDALNIGLKRAGEQYVYKLKPAMCYRLHKNDVIYIDNGRLLVM